LFPKRITPSIYRRPSHPSRNPDPRPFLSAVDAEAADKLEGIWKVME
jgi:hypothetical protein